MIPTDSNDDFESQNISSKGKAKPKNEIFYVKKRGLFRKADQVNKQCNSDVFIVVYHKDSDKVYSYQSDQNFNLEKITALVLREKQQRGFLNKNRKFEETDFGIVKQNLNKINSIQNQESTRMLKSTKSTEKSQKTISTNNKMLIDPSMTSSNMEVSISLSEQQILNELAIKRIKTQHENPHSVKFGQTVDNRMDCSEFGKPEKTIQPVQFNNNQDKNLLRIKQVDLTNQNQKQQSPFNENDIYKAKYVYKEVKSEKKRIQEVPTLKPKNQIHKGIVPITESKRDYGHEENSFSQTQGYCRPCISNFCNTYENSHTERSNTVALREPIKSPFGVNNNSDSSNKPTQFHGYRTIPKQVEEDGFCLRERHDSKHRDRSDNSQRQNPGGQYEYRPLLKSVDSGKIQQNQFSGSGVSHPSGNGNSGPEEITSKKSKESYVGYKNSSGVSGISKGSLTNCFLVGAMPPPEKHQNMRQPTHFGMHHVNSGRVSSDWKSQKKLVQPQRLLSPTAFEEEGNLLPSPRLMHQSSTRPMKSHLKYKEHHNRQIYRDLSASDTLRSDSLPQAKKQITGIEVTQKTIQQNSSTSGGEKMHLSQYMDDMNIDDNNNTRVMGESNTYLNNARHHKAQQQHLPSFGPKQATTMITNNYHQQFKIGQKPIMSDNIQINYNYINFGALNPDNEQLANQMIQQPEQHQQQQQYYQQRQEQQQQQRQKNNYKHLDQHSIDQQQFQPMQHQRGIPRINSGSLGIHAKGSQNICQSPRKYSQYDRKLSSKNNSLISKSGSRSGEFSENDNQMQY